MSHQHKSFSRSARVNEQIRRELADLLLFDVKDPRVKFVSLTGVEISADYAHAKVFFTALVEHDQLAEIERGLKAAAGYLRRQLGRRVRLHSTPELHFVHDPSIERGSAMSKLIDEAIEVSRQTPED
jgi:ribosome-binding factor A